MNRNLLTCLLSWLILWASPVPAETIALVGGQVHPVSKPQIAKGTVLIRDGKIAAVGSDVKLPPDAKVVNSSGKHIYPSLFPPLTVLGLVEIQSVRGTVDVSEIGDINPEARADLAVNFDSELLPVARSAGILIAGVAPTGGIISGTLAALKLEGWTREDATLKSPAAVVAVWPNLRLDHSPRARLSLRLQEQRRDEALEKFKSAFADAKAYAKARAAEGKRSIPRHDFDPKMEALAPVVEGKIPLIVTAESLQQIRAALRWAKEENLKIILAGAADAWRVADELAKASVPVILHPPLALPQRVDEPYDANFAAPGILAKAGVRIAFNEGIQSGSAAHARDLPQQAAMAVAFGLPKEKALEALTLEPARILGVADRVGSLEAGKDATLFVSDGDILDLRSHVVAAYLDGRALDLSDRHKRLYERYRNRPRVRK